MSDCLENNREITSGDTSIEQALHQTYYDEYDIDIGSKETVSKLEKLKNWFNDLGGLSNS